MSDPLLVLVVDDDRDAAESLALLLCLWGHEPVVAYDGPTALALALARHPDLILLDIALPGLDGYEVARRLRELPGVRDARIWALTGHARDEDRQRALEAGCDAHLVKPLAPEALRELLEGIVRLQATTDAVTSLPA
jgi:CheY-like chemotaxis protein